MRIEALFVLMVLFAACRPNQPRVSNVPKLPVTHENLDGYWTSKEGGAAEIRFSGDSIYFIEDGQAFSYSISGDSIRFDFEYATFFYRVELPGGDQLRMTSPHMTTAYQRVREHQNTDTQSVR